MSTKTSNGEPVLTRLVMYLRSRASITRRARGIIHVGANLGQERDRYAKHRRPVVWIEPDPSLVPKLREHVAPFPEQRVIEALIGDVSGREVDFHIASNNGGSSSILEMKDHARMFPNVRYERTIRMATRTLPEVLEENGVDLNGYDALIMDTQGSELMILRGAEELLNGFRFVQIEVPDFESYEGCVMRDELVSYMDGHGFSVYVSECFKTTEGLGSYYDITFKRRGGV